jgi:hypothetical protein
MALRLLKAAMNGLADRGGLGKHLPLCAGVQHRQHAHSKRITLQRDEIVGERLTDAR